MCTGCVALRECRTGLHGQLKRAARRQPVRDRQRIFKDGAKWRALYRDNLALVGEDPDAVLTGVTLRIDCPKGAESKPAITRVQSGRINMVTAEDLAPFTDRNLPQGGMITELVSAAKLK